LKKEEGWKTPPARHLASYLSKDSASSVSEINVFLLSLQVGGAPSGHDSRTQKLSQPQRCHHQSPPTSNEETKKMVVTRSNRDKREERRRERAGSEKDEEV
jgi:hypothetical protein